MSITQGTAGALIPFAATACGVLSGLIVGRARWTRFFTFPFWTILVFLGEIAVSSIIGIWLPKGYDNSTLFFVTASLLFALIGYLVGRALALTRQTTGHVRGAIIEHDAAADAGAGVAPTLTFAGLGVAAADETKHFKLLGTTGTGKSTAIRELLGAALERGDRAVIADAGGSYLNAFYDAQRGDRILNPFDTRATRWDLFAELESPVDADQLARSLIADGEGEERIWRNYARVFITAVLRQLQRAGCRDVAQLYVLLSSAPAADLRDLLRDTPAGPYLAEDNGKFFQAVRSVANTHLASLEFVARQSTEQRMAVRPWVRERQGRVLFLPYRPTEIGTLRGLISTWMRLAIFEAMNQEGGDQRLWFVIDELDALGAIDGLKDALARLRKFGGRCVLGFQSIAQVSGTYGAAEAQTIVENCGNTLILRCSASEGGGTARFASQLIGEREIVREQTTHGRSGGAFFASDHRSVSTTHQIVTESAILASEIEQLPDLTGYLKLASKPEWRKVRLPTITAKSYPA